MSNRFLSVVVSLSVMIAMTLGMLPFSGGHWLSHSPTGMAAAVSARHVQAATQTDEHGHVHDDGDVDVQAPGHSHGHNPADHSHETPSLPASLAVIFKAYGQSWQALSPALPVLETAFRLERPPRPMLDA